MSKEVTTNVGLYTSLPVPEAPWEDASMDFVLELLRKQRCMDSVMAIVDRFFKMTRFVPCRRTIDSNKYCRSVIQGDNKVAWCTEKYNIGSGYKIYQSLLKEILEEIGNQIKI